MTVANLRETINCSITRRAELQKLISELQDQKSLAVCDQADCQSLLSAEKHSIRDYFKKLYEEDPELQAEYKSYTEIQDFEDQIDKITAKYNEQLQELVAWETAVDAQITTNSTELEEINAYLQSYKSMLSTNIQDDFNYGLN